MTMREIGVVHMDMMSKGGGEAVAMNIIEALQDEYEITLITLTNPDIPALNEYFNTAVTDIDVEKAGYLAPWLNRTFTLKYYVLENALLGRYARRHAEEYDLLISTINELGLETNSIQYIHFPFDWMVSIDDREHIFHPTVEEESLYERLCTVVADVDLRDIRSNTLLANSEWTADAVKEAYGARPDVVHPPVDTSEFVNHSWDDRESGFVTVGRIERSKRIAEMIEIIDHVRQRGHETHLHIVGPTVDEEYYDEIEAMADTREYVILEGEIPRSELVERICSHQFGIHGKEYEHFGMAVAELAAGGTIPFVPANGGQHAIVRDEEYLLYDSLADAVERIDRVLSNPELQSHLRMGTDEIRQRFGCERFHEEIRAIVSDTIEQPPKRVEKAGPKRERSPPSWDGN